jgi:hypothetical protein
MPPTASARRVNRRVLFGLAGFAPFEMVKTLRERENSGDLSLQVPFRASAKKEKKRIGWFMYIHQSPKYKSLHYTPGKSRYPSVRIIIFMLVRQLFYSWKATWYIIELSRLSYKQHMMLTHHNLIATIGSPPLVHNTSGPLVGARGSFLCITTHSIISTKRKGNFHDVYSSFLLVISPPKKLENNRNESQKSSLPDDKLMRVWNERVKKNRAVGIKTFKQMKCCPWPNVSFYPFIFWQNKPSVPSEKGSSSCVG